jgi:hypothetical protein
LYQEKSGNPAMNARPIGEPLLFWFAIIYLYVIPTLHITYKVLKTLRFQTVRFVLSKSVNQGCQMVYFQTKNPILVIFGRSCNRRCWSILRPFGIFYGHLRHFMAIRYIMWLFGIFFIVLVCCTKKNLATLVSTLLLTIVPKLLQGRAEKRRWFIFAFPRQGHTGFTFW